MGRNRKPADRWMPTRVYRGKSAYELHPQCGGSISLCPLDATQAEVWAAFEKAKGSAVLTVENLANSYFKSANFLRRRPRTQKDYEANWKILKPVFSKADATKVQQKHIRHYMDKRGKKSEVRANREKSVLHNIFAWAFERSLVKINPCVGVKSFPEKARERYIEDDEYHDFLAVSSPIVQVFMEVAYLCGARGQDVRKITLRDITAEGLYIQQEKTGKKQIKRWTPRLEDAVAQAQRLRREILGRKKNVNVDTPYLLISRYTQPYTAEGLKTVWAKNRARIKKEHKLSIDWTYHDIKAKGISDFEGDYQTFSGHKTRAQADKYRRRPEAVDSLEVPERPLSGK